MYFPNNIKLINYNIPSNNILIAKVKKTSAAISPARFCILPAICLLIKTAIKLSINVIEL